MWAFTCARLWVWGKRIRNKINRVPHGICLGKQVGKIVNKGCDFAKDICKGYDFPFFGNDRWKRNMIGKLNLEVFNENRNIRKCNVMGERGHVRVFQAETRY